MEYLGHIILAQGVSTDPGKVAIMLKWPVPVTIKQRRGFLGLTGYYRRFIKHYGLISKPLTDLLKKNAFHWNALAQSTFEQLKAAMASAPGLAIFSFSLPFTIETDASGVGIGALLVQQGHPIAYLSKTLAPKHHQLSAYEKEFMVVVLAVEKWRPYLLGRYFIVKTDHFNLKYLLEQKVTIPFQSKWLPKLMGFDYDIVYRKGKENIADDNRSRILGAQLLTMHLSTLDTNIVDKVKLTWQQDPLLQTLIQSLMTGASHSKYT